MISCRFGEGLSTLAISSAISDGGSASLDARRIDSTSASALALTLISTPSPTSTPAEHVSPALASAKKTSTPAYELKFLLSAAQASELERRAAERLTLDPYADPTLGHAYEVTSVYFDTPNLDVCRRSKGFRRHKHRIRRYGAEAIAHLERKSKKDGQVYKRRVTLPWDNLDLLNHRDLDKNEAETSRNEWTGQWFARQLTKAELRPVCRVTYQRTAFVGSDAHGSIRMTMDRMVTGALTRDPHPERLAFDQGSPLLNDEVIVEFKYLVSVPTLFKAWIEEMRLAPSSISKYRRCAQACGLTASAPPISIPFSTLLAEGRIDA